MLAPDLWLVPLNDSDGDGDSEGDDNGYCDGVLIVMLTTDLEASVAQGLALDWAHTQVQEECAWA